MLCYCWGRIMLKRIAVFYSLAEFSYSFDSVHCFAFNHIEEWLLCSVYCSLLPLSSAWFTWQWKAVSLHCMSPGFQIICVCYPSISGCSRTGCVCRCFGGYPSSAMEYCHDSWHILAMVHVYSHHRGGRNCVTGCLESGTNGLRGGDPAYFSQASNPHHTVCNWIVSGLRCSWSSCYVWNLSG